jgi:hypothetical protein
MVERQTIRDGTVVTMSSTQSDIATAESDQTNRRSMRANVRCGHPFCRCRSHTTVPLYSPPEHVPPSAAYGCLSNWHPYSMWLVLQAAIGVRCPTLMRKNCPATTFPKACLGFSSGPAGECKKGEEEAKLIVVAARVPPSLPGKHDLCVFLSVRCLWAISLDNPIQSHLGKWTIGDSLGF